MRGILLTITNKEYVKLYYNIKSTKDIAEYLGITEGSVRRISSNLGLKKSLKYINSNKKEVKEIPNFSRYLVDEDGIIFRKKDNLKLTYSTNNWGYLETKLVNDDGIRKSVRVHRIVCYAFYGYQEQDTPVNHIDCNKKNNRFTNLEWSTHSENLKHAYDNNLRGSLVGNANNRSILEVADVESICSWYLEGLSVRSIKDRLDVQGKPVNPITIRQILKGKRWKHVTKKYNINYNVNRNVQRLEKS